MMIPLNGTQKAKRALQELKKQLFRTHALALPDLANHFDLYIHEKRAVPATCVVAKLYPIFAAPWTVAPEAPLSMEFPRQEYWSRLAFPSPDDLPNPGIELASTALAGRFFATELTREAQ